MTLEAIARKHGLPVNKHRNHKVEADGQKFDSKREYRRYLELTLLERAGKISDLKRQVPFILAPAVVLDGRKKPALKYYADFTYKENGELVIEDAKGRPTPEYRIKRHLLKTVCGLDVREV